MRRFFLTIAVLAAIVLLPSAFTDRANAMTNPLPAGIANAVQDLKVAELAWLLAAMLVYRAALSSLAPLVILCRSIYFQTYGRT